MNAIKTQIIARLLAALAPLKKQSDQTLNVRKIERVTNPTLMEEVRPAIHVVIGQEAVLEQDERGYTCEFPAVFRIIFEDARDPYTTGDKLAALVQTKIEGDEQLTKTDGTGLASKITYEGDFPYANEINKPAAGIFLTYSVEYRRYRADPERSY